jgi:hypothetical protein
MDWRYGSSGRVPDLQAQSPEFRLQSRRKEEEEQEEKDKENYKSLISVVEQWCLW